MNRPMIRMAAWPMLAMSLAAPLMMDCSKDPIGALEGCDEFKKANFNASADLSSNVDDSVKALLQASADLRALAESMRGDVGTACRNIALAQNGQVDWDGSGEPTDDQVTQACTAASDAIHAVLSATGDAAVTFQVTITGARCEADLNAQADCTGKCSESGSCDPGDLSVSCSATALCEGTCDDAIKGACVGSTEVPVKCEGECTGSCQGTCSGACQGTVTGGCEGVCEGKCDGQASNGQAEGACTGKCEGTCSKPKASATCDGQCDASCTGTCGARCAVSPINVECKGKIECKGHCTGSASCTGTVKPPSCDASVDCKASCQASVQATANCTPPSVEYVVEGKGAANAKAFFDVLATEIPKLYLVANVKGQAAIDIVSQVSGSLGGALKAAVDKGGKAAVCAGYAITAFGEASTSVSVSFHASASASGSATTGSGN